VSLCLTQEQGSIPVTDSESFTIPLFWGDPNGRARRETSDSAVKSRVAAELAGADMLLELVA
jgi:hypothetical protein